MQSRMLVQFYRKLTCFSEFHNGRRVIAEQLQQPCSSSSVAKSTTTKPDKRQDVVLEGNKKAGSENITT